MSQSKCLNITILETSKYSIMVFMTNSKYDLTFKLYLTKGEPPYKVLLYMFLVTNNDFMNKG